VRKTERKKGKERERVCLKMRRSEGEKQQTKNSKIKNNKIK